MCHLLLVLENRLSQCNRCAEDRARASFVHRIIKPCFCGPYSETPIPHRKFPSIPFDTFGNSLKRCASSVTQPFSRASPAASAYKTSANHILLSSVNPEVGP